MAWKSCYATLGYFGENKNSVVLGEGVDLGCSDFESYTLDIILGMSFGKELES